MDKAHQVVLGRFKETAQDVIGNLASEDIEYLPNLEKARTATTVYEIINALDDVAWDIDSILDALLDAIVGEDKDKSWTMPEFST